MMGVYYAPHWRDNMNFKQWADKYGLESARRQFGFSDHLFLSVTPKRYVIGRCGNYTVTEPLITQSLGEAIRKIRKAVQYAYETEEIVFN